MTRRQPDEFARAVYAGTPRRPAAQRWRRWRRTGLPVVAVIAIVVASAAIIDLPRHESLASQRAAAASLLDEVNTDVGPCAFALTEADTLYRDVRAHRLNAAQRAKVPTLLQDDEAACSFTSGNINDLAGIEEPGTGAGRWLAQVVALSTTWTTSDALGAIDDLDSLLSRVADRNAAKDLAARARYLGADRRSALAAMSGAERYLAGSLPAPNLPPVSLAS